MSWLERLIETPEGIRRLKLWFYVSLGLIVVAEIVLPYVLHDEHTHFAFEHLPAWGAVYGLFSCVAIIVVSKWIGKLWLMKPEDYYDR